MREPAEAAHRKKKASRIPGEFKRSQEQVVHYRERLDAPLRSVHHVGAETRAKQRSSAAK